MNSLVTRLVYFSLTLIGLTFVMGCPGRTTHDANIKRLESDIAAVEKQVAELEERSRGEGTSDPGKHNELVREKTLANSRLERLKELLTAAKSKLE